jgi:hypothetical protein
MCAYRKVLKASPAGKTQNADHDEIKSDDIVEKRRPQQNEDPRKDRKDWLKRYAVHGRLPVDDAQGRGGSLI